MKPSRWARGRRGSTRVVALVLASVVLLGAGAGVSAGAEGSAARASGVTGYRERVGEARAVVETYIASGAVGDGGALASDVLAALPAVERVDVEGTEVTVDSSILRSLVARLGASRQPAQRLEIAEDMVAHLVSIERSLPGVDEQPVPSDPTALAALLADTRTQSRSPLSEALGALIERLGEAFERWQASLASAGAASRIWSMAVTALAVAIALLVVVLVARTVLRLVRASARRGPVIAEEIGTHHPVVESEADLPADAFAFAESLAGEERFAEAVRALFGGAARLLAEHGHVTRTRTRTNGELVAEVCRELPGAVAPLSGLATTFERAFYGHVAPGEKGYREARAAYGSLREVLAAEGGGGAS